MRKIFTIVLLIFFIIPVNCLAGWPWSEKPLLTINQVQYSGDDFVSWWDNWRDGPEHFPEDINEYVEWLLLLNESEKMELDTLPGVKRKIEVFLTVRALMFLKNEEVDSKIEITDDEIKAWYEMNYSPRYQVSVLNFLNIEQAKAAHEIFSQEKATFDDLKDMSVKGDKFYFSMGHPKWITPNSAPQDLQPFLPDINPGQFSKPTLSGENALFSYVIDKRFYDLEDFKAKEKIIKEEISKLKHKNLTKDLISRLFVKFNFHIDYDLLNEVDLLAPAEEDLNKIVVSSDPSKVTVQYFIEQCKKENTFGKLDLSDHQQQNMIKNRVLNIMISNSVVEWEALSRHYEDKMPFKTVYEFYKRNTMVLEFKRRLYENIKITEEEVKKFYTEHENDFAKPEEINLVMVEGSFKEINMIWAEVISGADLAKTASKYKIPIKINVDQTITFESLEENLRGIVKKLKPGQLSQPIKGKKDYSLVKLKKINSPAPATLKEVKHLIEKKLKQEKRASEKKKYIDQLILNSDIMINNDVWQTVKQKLIKESERGLPSIN